MTGRFMTNEVGCIVDLEHPQLKNYDGQEIVDLLNELNRLAEANEERGLAIMTYLHDNYYEIWEEVNKEVFREMTTERFEVIDHFDIDNKPIKAIRDTETTEIYTMDNGFEANSTCMKLNTLHEDLETHKQYYKTLGIGITKIIQSIEDDKESTALIMCWTLLKKLVEEELLE